jgi:DNA-directed RNA polymerase specialized sigma24 family protein/ribosome-associated translation inhibitor RaiA
MGVESALKDQASSDPSPSSEAAMNVHVSYKVHKTPDIEKEMHHQVEKLRRRLQVFRPELVHLKGIVEQSSAREGFIVALNLRLPSGQMAVQQSSSAATTAVKGAFEDLLQQLGKHKDQLRNQRNWPRWRRVARTRPQPEVPFEQTIAAVQAPTVSDEDVSSYVNANLLRLQRFVERELLFRESMELISPESITPEEVIDETIATALGNNMEKPEKLALEPWLYRIAIRTIDLLAVRDGDASDSIPLEMSARTQNVRGSNEPQLQYHQPDELLMEENVIPDRRVATPEEIVSSDEMMALVEAALRGVERGQREAFILQAIEGFTVDEVAAITGREPEQVRSSIAATREHLRKNLPVPNLFRDRLLQHSGSA